MKKQKAQLTQHHKTLEEIALFPSPTRLISQPECDENGNKNKFYKVSYFP